MHLSAHFTASAGADGIYRVRAKGYLVAILRWATVQGSLWDWTSFGMIALNASGEGQFTYGGGRSIPCEATHVAAELIAVSSSERETLLLPLPPERIAPAMEPNVRFMVASDFHLSAKTERIRRALRLGRNADCFLLPGDLTNDGDPAQFELFKRCIEEELPNTPVLSVAGNHDYPKEPFATVFQGCEDYGHFQAWLIDRARALGVDCAEDESGAYCATFKGINIIGLNAVSHWRRFVFPHGSQIKWLRTRLVAMPNRRHIILCHAPLIAHCPARDPADAPYLSRDTSLQQAVDAGRPVIFLSGHTHVSLNDAKGCVTRDAERDNLYINDSSVVATTLKTEEPLTDHAWVEGAAIQICLNKSSVELMGLSIPGGVKIARGYYRFMCSQTEE